MAADQPSTSAYREDRAHFDAVLRALVVSAALHVLVFAGWKLNERTHFLDRLVTPRWVEMLRHKLFPTPPVAEQPVPVDPPPMVFVIDMAPYNQVERPNPKTSIYSAKSTKAANPTPAAKTEYIPKISGKAIKYAMNENLKLADKPMAPSQEPAPKAEGDAEPAKPEQAVADQERTIAKVDKTDLGLLPVPPKANSPPAAEPTPTPKPAKPRTLAQARQMRSAEVQWSGEKMDLDAGVMSIADHSSLETRELSFLTYNRAVIMAVRSRWFQLQDAQPLSLQSGHVAVSFRLHDDGTISDLKVDESTVNELLTALCMRAILDPAPYGNWPSGTVQVLGRKYSERRIDFIFN